MGRPRLVHLRLLAQALHPLAETLHPLGQLLLVQQTASVAHSLRGALLPFKAWGKRQTGRLGMAFQVIWHRPMEGPCSPQEVLRKCGAALILQKMSRSAHMPHTDFCLDESLSLSPLSFDGSADDICIPLCSFQVNISARASVTVPRFN